MCKKIMMGFASIFFLFCLWGVEIHEEMDTSQLIRLHVLANSNSEADQALKLAVKNEVVRYLQTELTQSKDLDQSRNVLQTHMKEIEEIAVQTLEQEESPYGVHLEYGHFDFPVKYYGGFSLPAGNYEALRVVIGEGQGNNWWCVLFPPMCFVDSNEVSLGQYSELSPKKEVTVKLRAAELWEQWQDNHQEQQTTKKETGKEPLEQETHITDTQIDKRKTATVPAENIQKYSLSAS